MKPEDAVADYSVLDEKELKVLNDWVRIICCLQTSIAIELELAVP